MRPRREKGKSDGLADGLLSAKPTVFVYAGGRWEWQAECNKERSLILDARLSS